MRIDIKKIKEKLKAAKSKLLNILKTYFDFTKLPKFFLFTLFIVLDDIIFYDASFGGTLILLKDDIEFSISCIQKAIAYIFIFLEKYLPHFIITKDPIPFAFFVYIFLIINSYIFLSYLGLYGVFISCLVGVTIFWFSLILSFDDIIINSKVYNIVFFKWFTLGNSININFEILIDSVSFSFAMLTTSIAVFVNIYAFSYFRYEPNVDRLILFLNSFVISMVLLVLSGNLIMLFLGWELIGLTSFLLINFWSTRVGTLKSAFKAYSFNKYSDFLIFLGIILTGFVFNDFNISNILVNFEKYDSYFLDNIFNLKTFDLISFFFLGAAFIKSAQIGFHIWLPDSMEAPVPASALIHSATLVSAGVFLILRLYPIFESSTIFYLVTPFVGISTAFFGGLVAFYQNDLKRILAYSTISHCGFLIFLTTLGSFEFTIMYLYVHGFFKAIAFLCVGNIIRFNKNYQDVRRMGQVWKYLPFEFSIVFLSLMNLSGLPFFFGFCIKHLVFVAVDNVFMYQLVYAILFLSALTGTFYFYKIIFYTFFDTKKARKSIYNVANRKVLFNENYSNSSLAAIISITLLTIVAYLVCFFFFYELIFSKYSSIYFNALFYKNYLYQTFNYDLMSLFNFSFLNWIVLLCIFFLVYIRWNNFLDNCSIVSNAYFIIVVSILSFFYLNLIFFI